jgi:catechol 2,3-dioxygenase-like lactoylglutathione lyase family enzyme
MASYVSHHIALGVADLDAQRTFYAGALGLTEVEESFELPEPRVRAVILAAANGLRLQLLERAGARPQEFADALDGASIQGFSHWGIAVDDLDAAYADVVAAGGRALSAPADGVQPGMRFAYVKDPEGNLLELIQPPA